MFCTTCHEQHTLRQTHIQEKLRVNIITIMFFSMAEKYFVDADVRMLHALLSEISSNLSLCYFNWPHFDLFTFAIVIQHGVRQTLGNFRVGKFSDIFQLRI